MTLPASRLTPGLLALCCAAACGPGPAVEPDAGDAVPDAGDAAVPDAGGFTMAPHQALPVMTKSAGPVLPDPKVVIATFDGDPLAGSIEAFAQALGSSTYWQATTSEYGVGPLAFSRSVALTGAPATTTDTTFASWLKGQLDGTHPEWGPIATDTVYTVVYPVGTVVKINGTSVCSQAPAFHDELVLASGDHVAYALLSRCDPLFGLSGIDYVTAGLSHEWIEASTDPLYQSNPAYDGPPSSDTVWTFATGGELADMCQLETGGLYIQPEGLPYTVQRSWSNASAVAGHDPCVPLPSGPYFGAAPAMPDLVSATLYGHAFSFEGVKVAVGASTTIDVVLFSDAETDSDIQVSAVDMTKLVGDTGNLTFAWDAQSGRNGATLHLTVTRVKDAVQLKGAAWFAVSAQLGERKTVWLGSVGN